MKDGIGERISRWFAIAIAILVVVIGWISIYPRYQRRLDLKAKDAELARVIEAKKAEIALFRTNQRRFRSDADFVEMIARKNRRVFPGELVFVFDE